MKVLQFKLIYIKTDEEFIVFTNNESYFIILTSKGLFRPSTAYPQDGIDYEYSTGNRPRVIGVDAV